MPLIPHFQPLPPLQDILNEIPAGKEEIEFVHQSRKNIRDILFGNAAERNERFLLIIGPCSIHSTIGAREYARKLKALRERQRSPFLFVMRFFFEKPRSSLNWKGLLYDPNLDGSSNLLEGIRITRSLMLDCLKLGIPLAAEFLDPLIYPFFSDLISWGCIGARTAESQVHRHLASVLPMPIGFKNPLSGELQSAVESVHVARHSHTFFGCHPSGFLSLITSPGNPDGHVVLRGGLPGPNYQEESVKKVIHGLKKYNLPETLLVDCAHGNSLKSSSAQKEIFVSIFDRWMQKEPGIKGALIESYLKGGQQKFSVGGSAPLPDQSITDPCLGWEETEEMLLNCMEIHQKEQKSCGL